MIIKVSKRNAVRPLRPKNMTIGIIKKNKNHPTVIMSKNPSRPLPPVRYLMREYVRKKRKMSVIVGPQYVAYR